MKCNTCGKWAGAHATLPGQPTDHLCMCPAKAVQKVDTTADGLEVVAYLVLFDGAGKLLEFTKGNYLHGAKVEHVPLVTLASAQAAENERLQADAIRYSYKEYAAIQQQQKAEIERLRGTLQDVRGHYERACEERDAARAALEAK